jgi:hypothetical protein
MTTRVFSMLASTEKEKGPFTLRDVLVLERGTFDDCMKEFDRRSLPGDELIIFPRRLVFIKK